MNKERRNLADAPQLREGTEGQSRKIEGYALVFDSMSVDLGGFREKIEPAALDGVLERSDVLALFNHNPERGVLARSRQGEGTLELTIDEKGLRYSFEAPNTALGDEVLEGVRRGDIAGSSFAFTVEKDSWEKNGEEVTRTIQRFGQIFDVSPVIHPAYEQTSVDARGLEALLREEPKDDDEDKEDEPKDEDVDDTEDKPSDDEPSDDDKKKEEDSEDEDEDKQDERKNNITTIKMEKKKFSLLGAIRALSQNMPVDDVTASLTRAGRRAIEQNGITDANGQIVIPLEALSEKRYEETPNGILASQNEGAATYGGEAVPTDIFEVLGPLRERIVLTELGARMLSLTGNVEIPVYSGAQCTWESEIGKAKNGAGKFRTVKMSPKRLTAKLPISKQWLNQTSPSVEALVREDLINCIADKLQATILGSAAGSNIEPKGLLTGVNADESDFTYADAISMEEALELAKVYGEKAYVLSPSAKAILRNTKIDEGSGHFVMENGEVLGTKAVSTGSVASKGMILGDWSNLYIATFGALDLTVDPYTLAESAQIQLVVNAWFDFVAVRDEAFVKRILK